MTKQDMIELVKIGVSVAGIALVVIYLTACTTAKVVMADGTKITYRDFHPANEAVEIDVAWEGVGTLSTHRNSEGVESLVDTVGSAVSDALNPLGI